MFHPDNYLPFLVRSFEDHAVHGSTTKDLQLYNYTDVEGIMFPQRQKVLYNEVSILEETEVSRIYVDTTFEEGFFDGLDEGETETVPSPPEEIPGYAHAELADYWNILMYGGPYQGTIGNASATQVASDLPGVHHLVFLDSPNVAQLILEFENSVIVLDAPPHQSDLVIEWVDENIGKPITQLWVSAKHLYYTVIRTDISLTMLLSSDFPSPFGS